MNEMTGPDGPEAAARRKEWDDAWQLLSSVRSTLADMLSELQCDQGAPKDLQRKISELEAALKTAFEVERKFNDWIGKQDGGLADGEIDIEAARRRISCRLDRLRACCREG
ncbi:hypothetical protein [Limimaricola sp.]|uniref:hypothetical protein n=1 Tax=Limimaricola sp. TaxID=2211665 RepID=UPI004059E76D